jgi:hypothetical protein
MKAHLTPEQLTAVRKRIDDWLTARPGFPENLKK